MVTVQRIDLGRPPTVAATGRARHGVGTRSDEYRLPDLWQLHLYDWSGELEVAGERHAVEPGLISLVPPATVVTFRYRGVSEHLYAHLTAPVATPGAVAIPTIQPAGSDLGWLTATMTSAVGWNAHRPDRTRAEIWSVLWRMVDLPAARRPGAGTTVDHVRAATAWIETRLGSPITVGEVAAAVGVSHHHLTRLFGERLGCTVIGYLRRRRVEHAEHLLRSTTMSIAAIAASVGIGDLQAFNKTCRAVTGSSPRQLRAAADG